FLEIRHVGDDEIASLTVKFGEARRFTWLHKHLSLGHEEPMKCKGRFRNFSVETLCRGTFSSCRLRSRFCGGALRGRPSFHSLPLSLSRLIGGLGEAKGTWRRETLTRDPARSTVSVRSCLPVQKLALS